jgi:nitrate reductase (cytochrome)
MSGPKLDRRQMLKLEAAAIAAAAGGIQVPALAANLVTERDASELKWDKAACRFCGTGCSVMVATKDNRVVATHGDIKAEVNRGLNCVKGYFLAGGLGSSVRIHRHARRIPRQAPGTGAARVGALQGQ